MIGHLAVGMAAPIKAFTYLTKQSQPRFAVSIGKIDVLAPVSARGNVVQSIGSSRAQAFYGC
jgi:hypothetical protein